MNKENITAPRDGSLGGGGKACLYENSIKYKV
jgi:hypothetical protein